MSVCVFWMLSSLFVCWCMICLMCVVSVFLFDSYLLFGVVLLGLIYSVVVNGLNVLVGWCFVCLGSGVMLFYSS